MVAVLLHIVGTDVVPEVVTTAHKVGHIKVEHIALTGAIEVVENTESFIRADLHTAGTQRRKPGAEFGTDSGKVHSCFLDVLFDNGNGDVLFLHNAIAANGQIQQHFVMFLPVLILLVTLHGHQHRLFKVPAVHAVVVDGDLRAGTGIKAVQNCRVVKEHQLLIVQGCNLVVNIREPVDLGILVAGTEDTVFPDAVNGDQVLHLTRDAVLFLFLCKKPFHRFQHIGVIPPSL